MAQWQTCSNNLVWTLIRSQCWKVYTWLNSCSVHDEKSFSSKFPNSFCSAITNKPACEHLLCGSGSFLRLGLCLTTPTVITPCRSYSAVFPCYLPSLNTSCRGCQGANRVSEHCQDHVGLFCFSDWLKKKKEALSQLWYPQRLEAGLSLWITSVSAGLWCGLTASDNS